MLWIIGFLTVVLLIDSLFLILLVLVQLPKKEAGLGQAFGSSATDALFGAGSGNALTKMTKYATGIFFGLTLAIYLMFNHHARSGSGEFARRIQEQSRNVEDRLPEKKNTAPTDTNATLKSATNVPTTLTNSKLLTPQAPPTGSAPAPATTTPAATAPAEATPTPTPPK